LAPAKLFLTLSSSAALKFQSQQTSRQQSGDILNHYATPAIYEVREFFEVGGLTIWTLAFGHHEDRTPTA
jgi:hypothetical protein